VTFPQEKRFYRVSC